MSDLTAYETALAQANDLKESELRALNIPMDFFIHESLRLYEWAGEDRAALEASGLDWKIVENLTLFAAALRHAQGLWTSERFQSEEAQRTWSARSPEAYELKSTLMHVFRFAFRKRPDLLRVVDMIAAGSGHVDMLQDLKDLSVAGRRNLSLLSAVGFDPTLLNRCETLAGELGMVYAEARNERVSYRQAKRVRDAMATLLKQTVDEVREYGQFVFWRDEQRRKGYTSEYHRQSQKPTAPSGQTTEETPAETQAEAVAE